MSPESNESATSANDVSVIPASTSVPTLSKNAELFLFLTAQKNHPMKALGSVLHNEGLTKPAQQAAALGLNKSTVSAMLKGTGKPHDATLIKIADFIGITYEQLRDLFPKGEPEKTSASELRYAAQIVLKAAKGMSE